LERKRRRGHFAKGVSLIGGTCNGGRKIGIGGPGGKGRNKGGRSGEIPPENRITENGRKRRGGLLREELSAKGKGGAYGPKAVGGSRQPLEGYLRLFSGGLQYKYKRGHRESFEGVFKKKQSARKKRLFFGEKMTKEIGKSNTRRKPREETGKRVQRARVNTKLRGVTI